MKLEFSINELRILLLGLEHLFSNIQAGNTEANDSKVLKLIEKLKKEVTGTEEWFQTISGFYWNIQMFKETKTPRLFY